jgi:hypothetical protein
MIPEQRVRLALLRVELRQCLEDISQINAAILHLLTGGKENYDSAKKAGDRQEDYKSTSDEILSDLRARRQEKEDRLNFLLNELSMLE